MEGGKGLRAAPFPPLHTFEPLRRTALNRIFAAFYTCAIIVLLYRHAQALLNYSTTSLLYFSINFSLLISDLVLAFMWAAAQAYRVRPIRRKEFPENLKRVIKEEDYPGLDVFICTADPFKEPPMNVVNTALSLMAYDYPPEKISVYVSDDGGSALTLFAFTEAAKFASYWLPFCREQNIMERSPEVYFASNNLSWSPEFEKIKMMYENMKAKVEHVVDKGEISDEYIIDNPHREAFKKWTKDFTRTDHPAVIQVILDRSEDKDVSGNYLPNLIYVSREKSKTSPHHFKAGALNALGPNYVGSGCFFQRRVFFGGPSEMVPPEFDELNSNNVVDKPIKSEEILEFAHHVAGCNYENQTKWGYLNGFRYGSLVEDYYTGFRLQCEGWKSLFCNPKRAAFLGDNPITIIDLLGQCKRWCIGLLEVAFSSKYNTLIYGSRSMGIFMGLAYSHYAFWPLWCIPVIHYSFLPQLALLNKVSILPKTSEPWFFLYVFLFLGAYGQDCLDFVLDGGSIKRWWNAQRMWMIRGLTCYVFGSVEYLLKSLGISTHGFTLTSKVQDDEQSKRYWQGTFEFGVPSPLFVPLTMAAIINLFSFLYGLKEFLVGSNMDGGLFLPMVLSGLIVLNCLPIYGAIALRNDKGKMPTQVTVIATFLSAALSSFAYLIFNQ
ncbi:Cellulose synthase [Corchorus olitorius]|uniref:Cellulose synthase n=1 Tax=Corchorus olitorius TaxID=93759 RepID=A0A1R3K718_9ROSI|nr:Cellulose synthase [Corchorus olitorius]